MQRYVSWALPSHLFAPTLARYCWECITCSNGRRCFRLALALGRLTQGRVLRDGWLYAIDGQPVGRDAHLNGRLWQGPGHLLPGVLVGADPGMTLVC